MHWSGTQSIIDYTTVPLGLHIEGQIWTGQATTVTALCPECGRIGVISTIHDNKRIMVHQGSDSGTIATWAARYIEMRDEMQFSLSGTLATMANGLPYSIGAAVRPDLSRPGMGIELRRSDAARFAV